MYAALAAQLAIWSTLAARVGLSASAPWWAWVNDRRRCLARPSMIVEDCSHM
jgi:hypothetical protein